LGFGSVVYFCVWTCELIFFRLFSIRFLLILSSRNSMARRSTRLNTENPEGGNNNNDNHMDRAIQVIADMAASIWYNKLLRRMNEIFESN
jgi:hypothetical protein